MDPNSERVIVYKMYSNFILSIKHFDVMQTFYRTMASTFLLGTFAAIGFLFSRQNISLSYENIFPLLLISAFGIASLFSLWHLDLIFYERLLVCNFEGALRLEKTHQWLPKVHHNMLKELSVQDKRTNVVYFYIGSITSLLLVDCILLVYLLKKEGLFDQLIATITTAALVIIFSHYLKKRTKKMSTLIELLEKK